MSKIDRIKCEHCEFVYNALELEPAPSESENYCLCPNCKTHIDTVKGGAE
jgi:Zn finger protein HypA/HybF involved in hydrogenase expression